MHVLNSVIIAFSTYTRFPMPQVEWTEENRKYTMCFFPLIGFIIGGIIWFWLYICNCLNINLLIKGAFSAIIPLMVTGGIHMDGFMDTTDALASWQTKEKKLEILKDSRVGAFAVIGCVSYLLMFAALFSEADVSKGPFLGVCFVLSRVMSSWTVTILRSARPNGMLDKFAATAKKRIVSISGCIYALICIVIWCFSTFWLALLCTAIVVLVTLCYRHMVYKHFGGVTGDLAGWYSQMLEICLVAMVILGGKLL